MKFVKQIFRPFTIGLVVGAVFLVAQSGTGATLKLNPIKPPAKQTTALTDEQQGILAVRGVKPAVVNIVGNSELTGPPNAEKVNTVRGSGFILESDGLIVTNSHVISDSGLKYFVMLTDGTEYDVKILGQDKFNDIAIIKIEATNLPVVKLGDSDALETGQTVFAVGNAVGKYQNSVTKGVVSGLSRSIDLGDGNVPVPRLQNLIQTDAAINHGNSGGPLVNLAGEVVGMNTVIDTSGSALGFAVPVNIIKNSVSQLKTYGKVSKPYAGIAFTTITKTVQILRGLVMSQGAFVNSVVAGGPAETAGIQAGDIVTEVNHQKLTETVELDAVIGKYPAGTQLLVTYWHNGEFIDAPLLLTEMQDTTPIPTIQLK